MGRKGALSFPVSAVSLDVPSPSTGPDELQRSDETVLHHTIALSFSDQKNHISGHLQSETYFSVVAIFSSCPSPEVYYES